MTLLGISTTNCPACGEAARSDFEAKGYSFSRCSTIRCGHVFVDPLPTDEDLHVFYSKSESGLENSDSWTLAADYATDPEVIRKFYFRSRIRFLKKKSFLNQASNVLDVGCSTGVFLQVLRDAGITAVTGVDVSSEQVEYCNSQFGIPAYRRVTDLPEQEFDLITLYAVLEHVNNPLELLQSAARQLHPEGVLLVDVPNYRSIYRWVSRGSWLWLIPPVHLQYFSPMSLVKLAERSGLVPVYQSTKSTSTYLYLLAYHLTRLLHLPIPETSQTGNRFRQSLIGICELVLRAMMFPISMIARMTGTHNQLIYVFRREVT